MHVPLRSWKTSPWFACSLTRRFWISKKRVLRIRAWLELEYEAQVRLSWRLSRQKKQKVLLARLRSNEDSSPNFQATSNGFLHSWIGAFLDFQSFVHKGIRGNGKCTIFDLFFLERRIFEEFKNGFISGETFEMIFFGKKIFGKYVFITVECYLHITIFYI